MSCRIILDRGGGEEEDDDDDEFVSSTYAFGLLDKCKF